jgi:hypothetical protein
MNRPTWIRTHNEKKSTPTDAKVRARQRLRCIGCGKFMKSDSKWNQCSDCDTRYPEEVGFTY